MSTQDCAVSLGSTSLTELAKPTRLAQRQQTNNNYSLALETTNTTDVYALKNIMFRINVLFCNVSASRGKQSGEIVFDIVRARIGIDPYQARGNLGRDQLLSYARPTTTISSQSNWINISDYLGQPKEQDINETLCLNETIPHSSNVLQKKTKQHVERPGTSLLSRCSSTPPRFRRIHLAGTNRRS